MENSFQTPHNFILTQYQFLTQPIFMILKYFNKSTHLPWFFSVYLFYWGFLFQNLWRHGQDVPQEDLLPAEASWRHRGPRSMCNNTASRLRGLVVSIALRGQITGCRLFTRQCGLWHRRQHSAFSFALIHTYTHTQTNTQCRRHSTVVFQKH